MSFWKRKMNRIDDLIENLKHEDFGVRYAADQALKQIGKPAVEQLIDALKKSRVSGDIAADILGCIGDARAIDPLCFVLNKDKDGIARYEAAKALGKIGKASVQRLIAALKHESAGTRQIVATILGEIGDSRAIEPLNELIKNEPEKEVRRSAKEALAVISQNEMKR